MSRNFTKDQLKTMCICRFYVTPGQTFTCPKHGEKTNRGVLTNPIVNGMKVEGSHDGKHRAVHKVGNEWKPRDDQHFKTKEESHNHLRLREILFRKFK